MAETSYDPLRNDPFQNNAVVPVPTSTTLPNQNQGQWSVPGQTSQQQQQQQQQQGGGVVEDPLLHFQNAQPQSQSQPYLQRMGTTDSSISGSSHHSHSHSRSHGRSKILDDVNIAPPPEIPMAKDYTQSLFHVEETDGHEHGHEHGHGHGHVADNIPPPSFDQIRHSGYCLARISFRTLLMKKWKQVFWICYGEHCETLLFFKTKEKFEDWIMNPHLNSTQREKMVKLRIDFNNSADERLGIKGYQVSALKRKRYSSGGLLHQFKLDKWRDNGPSIAAAFGSESQKESEELHMIMREMVRISPRSSTFDGMASSHGDDASGHFSIGQSVTWDGNSSAGDSVYSAKSYRSERSTSSSTSKGKYVIGNVRAAVSNSIRKMECGITGEQK